MSEDKKKATSSGQATTVPLMVTIQPPVASCKILRSPSHESVTTDLSLFSVSSIAASDAKNLNRLVGFKTFGGGGGQQLSATIRGPSPNPDTRDDNHTSNR